MLLKDSSIDIRTATPYILYAMNVADLVFYKNGFECVITSINDGEHEAKSKHSDGNAFDARSHHIPSKFKKEEILKTLKISLGRDYDVLLENLGEDNEHYHIEYDPDPRA